MSLTKQQIANLDKAEARRIAGTASNADLANLAYAKENHGYKANPRFVWPIDKVYITQGYGLNPRMYAKYGWKGHNGLDFRVRFVDSPLGRRYIVAVMDGIVEVARADAKGYGTHVRVRHADGSMTIYGHLTKSYVSKGQKVKQGERLGLSGNTGDSTGAHLHFEYRPKGWEKNTKNGYGGAVDPTDLFPVYGV